MDKEYSLEPGTGFAIIGRFIYPSSGDRRQVQRTDTYELAPGEGILFTGRGDEVYEPTFFKQSKMRDALMSVEPETVQMIVILEEMSGGLLITDPAGNHSYGITKGVPPSGRAMVVSRGRVHYAGIWGETQEEAHQRLVKLQQERFRRF